MIADRTRTFSDAQKILKEFAKQNGWKDIPNIDKFDHLHEELIEMSQHLRYKSEEELLKTIEEKKDILTEEFGDLIFGAMRLANQLGIDAEEAFDITKKKAFKKYNEKRPEHKIVKK